MPESERLHESANYQNTPKLAQNLPTVIPVDFCAEWNPEFANNKYHCCGKFSHTRRHSANLCAAARRKSSFCDEMTPDQLEYSEAVGTGRVLDVLSQVNAEMGRRQQSFCSVNTGFLAFGRRVVPTSANRILLKSPDRCVDFGTDPMVGMLEWVGKEIASRYQNPEYSGVHLVLGDVSAPRGGCLSGRSGRRGHASHTTGQDVDVGYLTAREGRVSPQQFHRDFDPGNNWWLIKKFLKNPYACVRVIFLDRKNIRKLAKAARNDEEWLALARFIRHMPGHKNHFHVRIGDGPGQPGCGPNARPELETEDDADAPDVTEVDPYDALPSGQSVDVNQGF